MVKLFGKLFGNRKSPIDHHGNVVPEAVSHIVLLVERGTPIPDDRGEEFAKLIYEHANPAMWKAIHKVNPSGVPCYCVETDRTDENGNINQDHILGSHLVDLKIPEESSVFVQLLTLHTAPVETMITLETIVETQESICVVSEKSPRPV